jgi:hypothetical protein
VNPAAVVVLLLFICAGLAVATCGALALNWVLGEETRRLRERLDDARDLLAQAGADRQRLVDLQGENNQLLNDLHAAHARCEDRADEIARQQQLIETFIPDAYTAGEPS